MSEHVSACTQHVGVQTHTERSVRKSPFILPRVELKSKSTVSESQSDALELLPKEQLRDKTISFFCKEYKLGGGKRKNEKL